MTEPPADPPAYDDSAASAGALRSPPTGRWAGCTSIRAGAWRIDIAALTDAGPVRRRNEDAVAVLPELGLALVIDGYHGMRAGVAATTTTVDVMTAELAASVGQPAGARLITAFRAASHAIVRAAAADDARQGSGATALAALFEPGAVTIAHIGECRAYLGRGGAMTAVTRDHDLVNLLADHGQPVPEAYAHSHVIVRSLGMSAVDPDVEVQTLALAPGDRLILCTDGIHSPTGGDGRKALDVAAICAGAHGETPRTAVADALLTTAMLQGSDNATVLVAEVKLAGFPPPGDLA